MENIKELNISIELWGGILCLIAVLCTLLNTISGKIRRNIMAAMQAFAAALLIFDSLAWYFRGSLTVVGHYMVRISNAAVFILSYSVIAAFSRYVAVCAVPQKRDSLYYIYMLLSAKFGT